MGKTHWIQHTHLLRADTYECSACGYECSKPAGRCPHCDRSMGKTKYDPSWVDEAEGFSAIFGD